MLQPAWLRAGMTSRRKLTGAGWSIALDLDGRHGLDAPPPRHDRGRAVAPGHDLPLRRDDGDLRVEAHPLERAGQVAGRAVGVGRRDDQLARGTTPRQGRLGRRDRHRGRRPDQSGRVIGRDRRIGRRHEEGRNEQGPGSRRLGKRCVERASVAPHSILWKGGWRVAPPRPLQAGGRRGRWVSAITQGSPIAGPHLNTAETRRQSQTFF